MHQNLVLLLGSLFEEAGGALDKDLFYEVNGLRPADSTRPADICGWRWGGAGCHFLVDVMCVTPRCDSRMNDPNWHRPGMAASEGEKVKRTRDRNSSAPVQFTHRYHPFVVECGGRLGDSALTVVYILAVLIAARTSFSECGFTAMSVRHLRRMSVPQLRNYVADTPADFRHHVARTRSVLLQRVSATIHSTVGEFLAQAIQVNKADHCAGSNSDRFLDPVVDDGGAMMEIFESPSFTAAAA